MDAMVADHERSTGPWEIERIVLPEAFCLMAGALKQLRFVLEGPDVDAQAMRRNIDMTHGLVMSEAVMMGLVLPTGYSFNLDGTAIYLTLASMFIAQACDIHLSWTQIAAMLGLMLLTSKGATGVTGGGFVALVATLSVMPDLPVAGVAVIVGIDRFKS